MAQGFITLDRKLQDHWLWSDKPFSRGQAWVDLLFLVNHRQEKIVFNGKQETVERGSRITSIRKLADRWGWSKSKVARFLSALESDEMIVMNSDTCRTALTVVNYDKYQSRRTPSGHKKDTGETAAGHAREQTKNDKRMIKNEKEGADAPGAPSGQTDEERRKRIAELRK